MSLAGPAEGRACVAPIVVQHAAVPEVGDPRAPHAPDSGERGRERNLVEQKFEVVSASLER